VERQESREEFLLAVRGAGMTRLPGIGNPAENDILGALRQGALDVAVRIGFVEIADDVYCTHGPFPPWLSNSSCAFFSEWKSIAGPTTDACRTRRCNRRHV